jgi:hypothetical protein
MSDLNLSLAKYVHENCVGREACILDKFVNHLPCTLDPKATVFVQIKCVESDAKVFSKRKLALLSSCMTIFASLVLLFNVGMNEKQS